MRVALAAVPCTRQPAANLARIDEVAADHADWGVDLLVFGEMFIHHFDAPTFDPQQDRAIAWDQHGAEMRRLRRIAARHRMRLCVGYLERAGETLYSSAIVLDRGGSTLAHQRRISPGWRRPGADAEVYRVGTGVTTVEVAGKRCAIALCGDLFDDPASVRRAQPEVVLWPLWRTGLAASWEASERQAYADQAAQVWAAVLMVNPVADTADGAAAWFRRGRVKAELAPADAPGVLVVDV